MPFKISELLEFMSTDLSVKILIVEGRRDVEFWKDIVPIADRHNCVIYSIDQIETTSGVDGNKGAAMRLALTTSRWTANNRIHYFLDADNDNLLELSHSPNVTLTDCRDVEAYSLIEEVFNRLCQSGASENTKECDATRVAIKATVRRVGVLRLASARGELNLPFQVTFRDSSLSRFFRKRGQNIDLRMSNLLDALISEAGFDNQTKRSALQLFEAEESASGSIADEQLVHGKDLTAFFCWYFCVPLDVAAGLIRLALAAEIALIRTQPRLSGVHQWVRAA